MIASQALAVILAVKSQLVLSSSHVNPSSPSIIDVDKNPIGIENITAWALIYTYPLTIFSNWAASVLDKVSVNEIYHQRSLATTVPSGVLKPNVDTIYSRVVLDLSTSDVVLTIPRVNESDRYWNYPVLDAFGNVIAEIGSVNNNTAGDYLIRRSDDVFADPGYDPSTPTHNAINGYRGIVNLPTTYGTMLIRYLLLQNSTEEVNTVQRYQNASKTTTLPRSDNTKSRNPASPLHDLPIRGSFLGIKSLSEQLEFAARLVPHNQPQIYQQRYRVASILSQAGLYNGHYTPPSGINLTQAGAIANASIHASVESPSAISQQGSGWRVQAHTWQGNYGSHYAAAASIALAGYQEQKSDQTLYPEYEGQGFSSVFTLQPDQSMLFTFSAKPKLQRTGFWSLTAYGDSQYLIPNPVDRYEVGDRTYNLTYMSGGKVYGPRADERSDGPFQVLLQDVEMPPPVNWTGNWLPVERDFSLIFRFYVPEPAMTNGSYEYPVVRNISAIVG